jgi:hypothetical protein
LEYVVTFSSVPWAVGGGAVINEDVARMIPYFMFNKSEGVLGSTDLEVKPLSTPGGSVRISPGGAVILGRGSGQFYEAYMGKNNADHIVAIAPNNSASQGTWRSWPAFASWTVSIPTWATTMDVQITLYSVFVNNDCYGETRVEVGSGEAFSQSVPFDIDPSGWERVIIAAGGTVAIPSGIRGKNKTFKLGARSLLVDGSHTGTLKADRGSFARLEIQFKEQVS